VKRVRQAIVVEGKYDEIRVHSVVNALVVSTAGFGIFRDPEQLDLLRRLAAERGLIILTDSDNAGMLIRNHLIGAIPAEQVRHAYVPPIRGKERRKTAPGKEGLLGVEGIDNSIILAALEQAGAVFEDEQTPTANKMHLTKGDLYELGLSGHANSAARRAALLQALKLPKNLSANRLLDVLNATMTQQEFTTLLQKIGQ
jgi:ribonuclease M5